MWVVFDEVRDGAKLVYPDNQEKFTNAKSSHGKVVAFYSGDLELSPYSIDSPSDTTPVLSITSVTGADYVAEGLHYFEATEGQEVTFTGDIVIPDSARPFTMPIIRKDTGRIIFARAVVFEGVLTATVRFPMSGLWETNAALVNQYRQPDEHLTFDGIQGVVVV